MKKNFLFSMLAVLLAGFWFGGASLAAGNAATVGGTEYPTLQGAIDAADDGDTVTLLSDVTLDSQLLISESKNIILDIGEHKIKASNCYTGNILVKGTLTLTGTTGKIYSTDAYVSHLCDSPVISARDGGHFIMNGGKIEAVIPDDPANKGQFGVGVFGNGSTVVINGGKIEAGWYAVSGNGNDENDGTTVTINGGQLISDADYAIYNPQEGTLIINSGAYIYGAAGGISMNDGTLVVNGGTIISTDEGDTGDWSDGTSSQGNAAINLHGKYGDVSSTINGGTIIGSGSAISIVVGSTYPVNCTVEGGIFSPAPATDLIADGKKALPYGENQYKVVTAWTVTFDPDNGSGTTDVDVEDNTAVAEPENPTNTGNVFFLGWFKDDNKYDFSTPVTASFTLTGKWEALSDSTGAVEDEDFTGVVLVPEEPEITGNAQTNIETAIASSNSTATMEGVVEVVVFTDNDEDGQVEAGDVELTGKVNFTTARLVRIPVNTTGNVIVKVRHTGQSGFSYDGLSTSSGATCSGGNATPAYNGEPITPTSGYVEIYTCAASTFVAYTETKNSTPTYGGGGGGSSSSYSCKSLPANAVANNTTKPKKNTNYSYSTDTGAVCTFQCKTGYTWNEKDAKCEKATETVADTNDTTVTENTENADTSDSASTEDLQKVLEDGYNVEFHNAYEFAFKNGITTMPTIQEADMNGNLNRIAMAKMLSQYAINVLGKTPDTTKEVPNFPDVDAQLDADYNNGVTLAYQLGIMGINIDEFRPFDLVTRAEFGTALSRMLFGIADGTELYYETHMQKLLEEKIITVANPDMHELRGYVMIMLMRSANK